MLELKNISYSYNPRDNNGFICKDFNLNVNNGEVVSLLGPSGCGKTTLVNIVASYLRPLGGEIFINGKKVSFPGRDRIVINQENDLFEWMTVYENMKMAAHDDGLIDKYLKVSRLYDFKNLYPIELSGGMKKRLSLARALATNAEFIIMDEPFGSLDNEIKEKLHEELLNIVKSLHKTILLVTHDIEEAIFLSDRVIILGGMPLKIRKEYNINFPYPRNLSIKDDNDFIRIKNEIKDVYRLVENDD